MTRILLTGSSGFVGQSFLRKMGSDTKLVRAVRSGPSGEGISVVGTIDGTTDWREALQDVTHVIHLAGQTPGRGVGAYGETNDTGTSNLVDQAIEAGVGTFIFMSSIFAVTDNASADVVTDRTEARSTSDYGRSKLAAEEHVARFARRGLAGISLRPPMVYGADAKGNWQALQRVAATGLPLPFGAIRNRRTLVSIDNLADAIVHAVTTAEPAKSGAYAVGDAQSVSLEEILRYLREGMGKPARLVPVPAGLMTSALKAAGRGQMADSLLGDLEVDSSRFRDVFGWQPVESAADGIRKSGREFAAIRR